MTAKLFYTQALTDYFNERFDDLDEIQAIAANGAAIGVADFIYYSDTNAFFDEYEDDIEDVCYDMLGEDYLSELAKGQTSIQALKNQLVWFVIEAWCQHFLEFELPAFQRELALA